MNLQDRVHALNASSQIEPKHSHLDYSNFNNSGVVYDREALGIKLSTPIVMMSAGILGNILALVLLFTADKHVRQKPFFILLAAMAFADLVGQAASGIVAVITYANNLQWVGGRPMCLYHGFIMVFFGVETPLLVCSISVERLLALRFSYFYSSHVTTKLTKIFVGALWTFIAFLCTWPLMGFGSYELQFPGSWCFLNFHRETTLDMAFALVFSVMNISVIAGIISCNVLVVLILLQMRRSRMLTSQPVVNRYSAGERFRRRGSGISMEMETQMVWFLLANTVVFCCLWLPINVHILINQFTGVRDDKQDLISVRLASINQIVDPWLYVILRKNTIYKILRALKKFFDGLQTVQTRSRSWNGDICHFRNVSCHCPIDEGEPPRADESAM